MAGRRSSPAPRRSSPRSRNRNSNRGSGRTFSLVIILFIFAITLAPPLKHYFMQRAQIAAVQSQLSADNKALNQDRKELLQWQDPNYIKSQARERLHFVLPGERQYIVTGVGGSRDIAQSTQVAKFLPAGQPWYIRLIASITEVSAK